MMERSTAVGVFTSNTEAEQGIEALYKAGFTESQIGYITRDGNAEAIPAGETEKAPYMRATAGVFGGGVIGGLAGAAVMILIPGLGAAIAGGMMVATLGGAVLGALTGGFAGTLIAMGIPEEEARYYQQELAKGCTIVTVKADGSRYQDALVILHHQGAYDASSRVVTPELDTINALPEASTPAQLPETIASEDDTPTQTVQTSPK